MFQKRDDVQISFDENYILVQSGDSSKRISNLIVTDKETNKIVGIGETEEEISSYNPELWEKEKSKIVFEPIYDPNNFNPEIMYWSLTSVVRAFAYELKGFSLFNNFDCQTRIPNYETYSKDARDYFEYSVQATMKFKKFIINNQNTGLDGWKFRLASGCLEWGRLFSYLLPIYLFLSIPDDWLISIAKGIDYLWLLVILLIVMAVTVWTIEFFWLLSFPTILPKKLIKWMFDEKIKSKWSISKLLSNFILRDVI